VIDRTNLGTRRFWGYGANVLYAVAPLIFGISTATLISSGTGGVICLVITVFFFVVVLRLLTVRLVCKSHEMTVRGFWRTSHIPWSQIVKAERVSARGFLPILPTAGGVTYRGLDSGLQFQLNDGRAVVPLACNYITAARAEAVKSEISSRLGDRS
jgi:hypothetical protein